MTFRYEDEGREKPDELRGRVETIPEGMGTKTRIAAVIFVVGATVFWIWALVIAPRFFEAPDGIVDAQYAVEIERRCAVAIAELQVLPTSQSVETPQDRGLLVEQANDALSRMREDLEFLPGGTEEDQVLIGRWLGDWDIYLADRELHAEKLLAGEDSRFLNREVIDAATGREIFVAERMSGFARRNEIRSCLPPGDL